MSEGTPFEKLPSSAPLDAEWYGRFKSLNAISAVDYLDGEAKVRAEERRKFEAGEVENPNLDYPKLDAAVLETNEVALVALKKDILAQPTENLPNKDKMEVAKQVYRWRLNEKIASIRMLQAAAARDIKRFQRYSEFIYGKPSPDVFAYTVHSLEKTLAVDLTSPNADLRQAAEELEKVLPRNLPEASISQLPTAETVAIAKDGTMKDFGYLLNIPEFQGEIDAPLIQEAFQQALTDLKAEGWKAVIDPNKTSIAVNQDKELVKIPPKRRVTLEKLRGLILHELATHVDRYEQGERSQLKLLGLGLDRYEGGEEGVATMREQAIAPEVKDFARLDYHLAISLAQGLDGTPRDFRQTYEIMDKFYLVEELKGGKEIEAARKNAAEKAWDRCVRTFRGTDCKTPGAAFTKDIIYREGNIGVWELIRTNPEEMRRFNVGKYDPTNSRHIWVLTQLGITEENLADLEQ